MYTSNSAIAYCPIVSFDDEAFRQIIVHEAGGHGFAKLLDEYAYGGTISDDQIQLIELYKSWYWGANIDVTNDPFEIDWAHLLADSRYDGHVGIYEGAFTYEFGAYRPSDYSIMRYNTGNYNAPSREEIYNRIMVLSGEEAYYEDFVEYDAINRSVAAEAYRSQLINELDLSTFVPLGDPVVIVGSPEID